MPDAQAICLTMGRELIYACEDMRMQFNALA